MLGAVGKEVRRLPAIGALVAVVEGDVPRLGDVGLGREDEVGRLARDLVAVPQRETREAHPRPVEEVGDHRHGELRRHHVTDDDRAVGCGRRDLPHRPVLVADVAAIGDDAATLSDHRKWMRDGLVAGLEDERLLDRVVVGVVAIDEIEEDLLDATREIADPAHLELLRAAKWIVDEQRAAIRRLPRHGDLPPVRHEVLDRVLDRLAPRLEQDVADLVVGMGRGQGELLLERLHAGVLVAHGDLRRVDLREVDIADLGVDGEQADVVDVDRQHVVVGGHRRGVVGAARSDVVDLVGVRVVALVVGDVRLERLDGVWAGEGVLGELVLVAVLVLELDLDRVDRQRVEVGVDADLDVELLEERIVEVDERGVILPPHRIALGVLEVGDVRQRPLRGDVPLDRGVLAVLGLERRHLVRRELAAEVLDVFGHAPSIGGDRVDVRDHLAQHGVLERLLHARPDALFELAVGVRVGQHGVEPQLDAHRLVVLELLGDLVDVLVVAVHRPVDVDRLGVGVELLGLEPGAGVEFGQLGPEVQVVDDLDDAALALQRLLEERGPFGGELDHEGGDVAAEQRRLAGGLDGLDQGPVVLAEQQPGRASGERHRAEVGRRRTGCRLAETGTSLHRLDLLLQRFGDLGELLRSERELGVEEHVAATALAIRVVERVAVLEEPQHRRTPVDAEPRRLGNRVEDVVELVVAEHGDAGDELLLADLQHVLSSSMVAADASVSTVPLSNQSPTSATADDRPWMVSSS